MPLLDELRAIVGAGQVITDGDLTQPYTVDWTRRFGGPALAVVRPADTTEVADLLRACSAANQPVLAQGGNTGLVGGAVPSGDDQHPPVILSTRRLVSLSAVDPRTGQVVAGAGVTLGELRRQVAAAGWEYGVDIAARDSATIGGNVATNAGGIRVCAYGMTRSQVVGLEAVLADGSVISHLNGLPKDNTGYDLVGLLVGSEGTLGVITAAALRLHRPVESTTVALIGVEDYRRAQAIVTRVLRSGARLLAGEIMDRAGTELVCELLTRPWPLASQHWAHLLLIEVEGDELDLPDDVDAVGAANANDAAGLWQYRETQSEAAAALAARHGVVIQKLDVSIPAVQLQDFADDLELLVATDSSIAAITVFGHLADGNLHLELAGPAPDDDGPTRMILELVSRHHGSIAGEHGIGRAKARYLRLSRTDSEIAAMVAIKRALDPKSILAPGVIFLS